MSRAPYLAPRGAPRPLKPGPTHLRMGVTELAPHARRGRGRREVVGSVSGHEWRDTWVWWRFRGLHLGVRWTSCPRTPPVSTPSLQTLPSTLCRIKNLLLPSITSIFLEHWVINPLTPCFDSLFWTVSQIPKSRRQLQSATGGTEDTNDNTNLAKLALKEHLARLRNAVRLGVRGMSVYLLIFPVSSAFPLLVLHIGYQGDYGTSDTLNKTSCCLFWVTLSRRRLLIRK